MSEATVGRSAAVRTVAERILHRRRTTGGERDD
jgi:hypothetical protein